MATKTISSSLITNEYSALLSIAKQDANKEMNLYLKWSIPLLILSIASFIWLLYSMTKKQFVDSIKLKELGYSKKEIIKPILCGTISILLISLIISIAFVFIFKIPQFPEWFDSYNHTIGFYKPNIRQVGTMLGVGLLTYLLSLIPTFYNYKNK